MKFLYRILLLNAFLLSVVLGQTNAPTARAQLSPVPPYPENGAIPTVLEKQYIFRDLKTGNLVLSYPVELLSSDTPVPVNTEGGRVKQVVALSNNVDPWFDVTVARNSDKFVYSYTLRNGSKAGQAIAQWRLASRAEASFLAASSQTGLEQQASAAPATWQRLGEGKGGQAPAWIARSIENLITPGSSLSGFTVTTALRPGFVRAFVSGSTVSSLNSLQMPAGVREQLENLKGFNLDQQTALTIGPKFSAATPDIAIVADFAAGVEIFIKHQYLLQTSAAVKELREKVQSYLAQSGSSPSMAAENYPHFEMSLKSKPETALEEQVIAAFRASLNAH